jgi:uncharacterized membrane protein
MPHHPQAAWCWSALYIVEVSKESKATMSWLYLHLVIDHFPIILVLLGTAACVLGAARRNDFAWKYGVITLAVGAALAIPSWITGYQAHYVVENRLGFPEGVVEPHETLAEATMWIMIPLAALAGFAWWWGREESRRGPAPEWLKPSLLIAACLGTIMLSITAFLGGKIGHGQPLRPLTTKDSAAALQQSFTPLPPESVKTPGTGRTTSK